MLIQQKLQILSICYSYLMALTNQTLIFVYNANSSVFSQITDYVHKITSPQTYQCNLFKLTYDNLGMKKEWKTFIQSFH